jgi:hypothetical protein
MKLSFKKTKTVFQFMAIFIYLYTPITIANNLETMNINNNITVNYEKDLFDDSYKAVQIVFKAEKEKPYMLVNCLKKRQLLSLLIPESTASNILKYQKEQLIMSNKHIDEASFNETNPFGINDEVSKAKMLKVSLRIDNNKPYQIYMSATTSAELFTANIISPYFDDDAKKEFDLFKNPWSKVFFNQLATGEYLYIKVHNAPSFSSSTNKFTVKGFSDIQEKLNLCKPFNEIQALEATMLEIAPLPFRE